MNHFPRVIGLCGVARAGKDSFCKYLSKELDVVRVAFADALKKDLDPFLKKKCDISAWTDEFDEKTHIRPMLVAYGNMMRGLTEGRYWVDKVLSEIEDITKKDPKVVVCVTDVRFPNEVKAIKNISGHVVHLSRYKDDGSLIEPPNEEEALNDPLIRRAADRMITWPTFSDEELGYVSFIKEFLYYYDNEN